MISKRTLATLGVVDESTLGTLDSFTRTFQVPFVTTTTVPTLSVSTRGYMLFLRPSYDEALLSLVRYYNWTRILYLYDSDAGHCSCILLSMSFIYLLVFTAQCTIVQSAVLRSHVVCLSVCPFVCLSVTLVDHDHIGWKSWKLIARTISPTSSLFVTQRSSTYSQGNMEKFWGENVRSTPTFITSGWIEST